MSHNTTVKDIKINDMDALRAAIAELSKEGAHIRLNETSGRFRTWRGQPDKCDVTIELPREQFDIGLQKQADGSYVPVFDHMLHGNASVSCQYTPGASADRQAIGKLMQRYAVCKAEIEAAKQGHMVSGREVNPKTGEISILIET